MDLKSGLPYWLIKSGLLATYPPLEQNTSCDVAVVGGGLTGALAAYFLAREGVDVLLVEKRDIGQGSTCANTALLLYELDTHLGELIERCGEATAVRSYQLGLEAIQAIESLVHGTLRSWRRSVA
jgi:glycine/D-amino acid oxidase-like deaminating enzyme